jgi:hypothetical protein
LAAWKAQLSGNQLAETMVAELVQHLVVKSVAPKENLLVDSLAGNLAHSMAQS